MLFDSDDANRSNWDDCLNLLDCKGVYHTYNYIKLLEPLYASEAKLFIYKNNGDLIYYPFLLRKLDKLGYLRSDDQLNKKFDIVSSWYYGGPLTNSTDPVFYENFIREFHSFCLEKGIISEFIRFDPYSTNHRVFKNSDLKAIRNRNVVYVDLKLSIKEIFSQFRKSVKYNYRKATRSNIWVKYNPELDTGILEEFWHLYNNEMIRKKAFMGYHFDYSFFKKIYVLPNTVFAALFKDDKLIGGDIIVVSDDIAHDFLRAAKPDFWKLKINDYLIIKNIEYLKENGMKFYDLQGGRRGVYEFKKGFSKLEKPFYIAKVIHDNSAYDQLVKKSKNLDLDFFPAYRVNEKN